MPTLAHLTDALTIRMGAGDGDPPHVHVVGPDGTAFTVGLDTLQVLRGVATRRAVGFAVAWVAANGDALARTWADLQGLGGPR